MITEEDVRGVMRAPGLGLGDWTEIARRELAQMLATPGGSSDRGPYWCLVERLERVVLEEALEQAEGNQLRAARMLGINRNTLRKKLAELGIESRAARGTPK